MDWLSNNWMYLALAVCVVILLALFGRRAEHTPGAGSCCGGMKHDKEGS